MKHLKKYDQYNESDLSFMRDEIKSIFKTDYDKFVKNIFNRIKETFDPDCLSETTVDVVYPRYVYELEETDSTSGFIKIEVADTNFFAIPGYDLWIDGEEINCSFMLKRSIYKYLNKKWKPKAKEIKKADVSRLQNKYNI